MQAYFDLPIAARLAAAFLAGACAGAAANWAVYSLRLDSLPLSPWCRNHPHDGRSRWLDRVPIWGWWRLQRKGKQLGYEFWLRPLVVEAAAGLLMAFLYWWEVHELGLVFPPLGFGVDLPPAFVMELHAQFLQHALLVAWMIPVTLIDIDEQTIPDEIVVPGTLLGLLLAAAMPAGRLPDVTDPLGPAAVSMHLASPDAWPQGLEGYPQVWPLALAWGCLGVWCLALLPRTWHARHGWRRAWGLLWARVVREPASKCILVIGLAAAAAIVGLWWLGGVRWQSLLSALVGMASGLGLVWSVRLIGGWTLRREAMGFGDVTLLAMIGAFLGWQAALLVFFVAPFAGLVIGVVRWVIKRDNVLPYGPFLCVGALAVIVRWGALWSWGHGGVFGVPWLAPAVVGGCLVLLTVLLALWRLVRG